MDIHELRQKIDELVYEIEQDGESETINWEYDRAASLVRTKLQEAKMWCGKMLEAEGNLLPKKYRDYCEKREE